MWLFALNLTLSQQFYFTPGCWNRLPQSSRRSMGGGNWSWSLEGEIPALVGTTRNSWRTGKSGQDWYDAQCKKHKSYVERERFKRLARVPRGSIEKKLTFSEPIEKELLRSTQIKMVYLIFKKLFKLKERGDSWRCTVHLQTRCPWVDITESSRNS